MASSRRTTECMFCGETPCVCNGPAPKPKRLSAGPKAKPAPLPVQAPKRKPVLNREQTQEELEFQSAIRALEPLLPYEEKERFSFLKQPPSDAEIKVSWRRSHQEGLKLWHKKI